MHELSIVMGIVDIASAHLQKANATEVEEIELEIGALAGIEMNSFDFAWSQAIPGTALQGAVRNIISIEGRAGCPDCNIEFSIQNVFDPCPVCNSHLIKIVKGKELRVKSLVVN
jgi:hydrogenase nickel incorporation protein HypA/HybF